MVRWKRGGLSRNLEIRRGRGGGGLPIPLPVGRVSLPVLLLIAAVVVFTQLNDGGSTAPPTEVDREQVEFVSFVLDDVQAHWSERLDGYQDSTLVVYQQATSTACGFGSAATGPFYCPADTTTYLDLTFFAELRDRFGAPGDFAQAYVIAHELGHHIQHLSGVMETNQRAREADPDRANDLSIELELQADCLAGVWGGSAAARDLLDPGDLEEGLDAAAAIGDDRLQRQGEGRVTPETWTHGSSQQRVEAFRRGFDMRDPRACGL